MNLDHIRTFIEVYRAGSFADVASVRNVAPSSISRTIASLEKALKTRLFQRSTRRLTPTTEGEEYYEKVLSLVEELDLVHHSFLNDTIKPSGRLRVTSSVSYGHIVIAPKLKAFRQLFPDIELELVLSDGRIDLINDQIDIAIRHGSLQNSSLIARKLTDVRYQLVASDAYLKEHGTPKKPEDLGEHELITFAYENFRDCWKFESNEASHELQIKPAIITTNAAVIRQCVRDGVGIALLADWTVEEDIQSGKLVELLPTWQINGASEDAAIWIVYSSRQFIPAKTKVFIEFLLNKVK